MYKTIDLFAGIGGMRLGFENQGCTNVFSSEIDKFAIKTYKTNFHEEPFGDITKIPVSDIPKHDILLGGFPCQPFSQAGAKQGFEDTRGTLFFYIAKILSEKQPKAFLLENVKHLKGHDGGKTLQVILNTLRELGYYVPDPQILNANDFGVPQNRERLFIVGFNKNFLSTNPTQFIFPAGEKKETRVGDILEKNVDTKFDVSDKMWQWHLDRKQAQLKKGNGFGYSLFNEKSKRTNTISARYYKDGNEALIEQDGKNPRRLTPRECARLQGFPDSFQIPVSNTQAYKQFGNSVCVKVIDAIAKSMIEYLLENTSMTNRKERTK